MLIFNTPKLSEYISHFSHFQEFSLVCFFYIWQSKNSLNWWHTGLTFKNYILYANVLHSKNYENWWHTDVTFINQEFYMLMFYTPRLWKLTTHVSDVHKFWNLYLNIVHIMNYEKWKHRAVTYTKYETCMLLFNTPRTLYVDNILLSLSGITKFVRSFNITGKIKINNILLLLSQVMKLYINILHNENCENR